MGIAMPREGEGSDLRQLPTSFSVAVQDPTPVHQDLPDHHVQLPKNLGVLFYLPYEVQHSYYVEASNLVDRKRHELHRKHHGKANEV